MGTEAGHRGGDLRFDPDLQTGGIARHGELGGHARLQFLRRDHVIAGGTGEKLRGDGDAGVFDGIERTGFAVIEQARMQYETGRLIGDELLAVDVESAGKLVVGLRGAEEETLRKRGCIWFFRGYLNDRVLRHG